MRKTTLIAIPMLIIPSLVLAQDNFQCTYGDMVRRVVIMSEPGVSVPCEVHYYKDTEAPGEDQILWSAGQQAGYCEQKAAEFVTRLEGWGWDCGGAPAAPAEVPEDAESAEPAEAPEEEPDMTEDLLPADDEGG